MTRDEEIAFYANDDAMEPAGPPVRRTGSALTEHVPIRFSPEAIAAVRRLADRDGITVSTWIRRAVDREIVRFAPPTTTGPEFEVFFLQPDPTQTQGTKPKELDLERIA